MLEPVWGTPPWRPETSGNIWSLLCHSQNVPSLCETWKHSHRHFSQHIGYSELEDIRQTDIFVHVTILVPRATIPLTCGRDRELWLCPTPEVHDSRTFRQIWHIWLAENMKRLLCTCSENKVLPELSFPAACQNDRGLWGREWHVTCCPETMPMSRIVKKPCSIFKTKRSTELHFIHAHPPKDPKWQTTVLSKSSQCNLFAANSTWSTYLSRYIYLTV